jgi:hypothetical protein
MTNKEICECGHNRMEHPNGKECCEMDEKGLCECKKFTPKNSQQETKSDKNQFGSSPAERKPLESGSRIEDGFSTNEEIIERDFKEKNPCGKYFKEFDRVCGEDYNLSEDFGFNQHNIFIFRTWYCPKCVKTTFGFQKALSLKKQENKKIIDDGYLIAKRYMELNKLLSSLQEKIEEETLDFGTDVISLIEIWKDNYKELHPKMLRLVQEHRKEISKIFQEKKI